MIEKFVIVSPSLNEEANIETTIQSVIAQTRRPDRWLIVDDGSTDATPDIVARYSKEYPWIELIRRESLGRRKLGYGGVTAFNYGVKQLGDETFDVIAALDSDIEFAPETFERLLRHFNDERVGMVSGWLYERHEGELIRVRYEPYHLMGALKMYRGACFRDIGGPPDFFAWDILDETEARRLGWITLSDPEVPLIHLRMQDLHSGLLKGRYFWGMSSYAIGSHPLFGIGRGIYRMFEKPWILGGLAVILGYLLSVFNPRVPRNPNPDLVRHLRREQLHRLFHGNRLPPSVSMNDGSGFPKVDPDKFGPPGILPSAYVLGVKYNTGTIDEINDEVNRLVDVGGHCYVVSSNVFSVNLAQSRPWMKRLFHHAQIARIDGAGIIMGGKLLGRRTSERLTWADWAWPLADALSKRGRRLFLLGGPQGLPEEAAKALKKRQPNINIVGMHHGYFQKSGPENEAVVKLINDSNPDVVWVGLGMPLQEEWLLNNQDELPPAVYMTNGAALRYIAGWSTRSPEILIKLHSEWLWRFIEDPKAKFGRYIIGNPVFLWRLCMEKFGFRKYELPE